MNKIATMLVFASACCAGAGAALAGPQVLVAEQAGAAPNAWPRKNPGDMSYRTALRMQEKVAALLPSGARLISPSLRLSIADMDRTARDEFLPRVWGLAIVGKTAETRLPMQRGGYFSVPAVAHLRSRQQDAIVMFNAQSRKSSVDIGWHVKIPESGQLGYRQFRQALDELKQAQAGIAWWDIPLAEQKRVRLNALRACFVESGGAILVAGRPAGTQLSAHCSLLAFDPERLGADPAIAFQGKLDYVTLDTSAGYPDKPGRPGSEVRKLSEAGGKQPLEL